MSQPSISSVLQKCPICEAPAKWRFQKQSIPFYQCSSCKLFFSRPSTNPNWKQDLNQFEDAYLQYFDDGAVDDVNFRDQWEWLSSHQTIETGKILDIGCGSGKWVRYLNRIGQGAVGIEPCGALYDRYLKDSADFYSGQLQDASALRGQKFDTITCFDVLEHVEDPLRFLGEIKDKLAPNGTLYLSTPNVGSALAKCMGRQWHFFCPYHLSLFSARTLVATTDRLGLQTINVSHRGRYRSIGYTLGYAWEFLLRQRRWKPSPMLNDRSWYLNLGDTMYCVLRHASQSNHELRAA